MSSEYRLVVERPEDQQGRRQFRYKKQSLADAERSLNTHNDHAVRMYDEVGLVVWDAWIETRSCTDWHRLDEGTWAVPV